ncbi:hypothetical protein CISIN_1g048648mg [Citrus sinensis]|uniref:UBC core domain-containing protein n=1 Tax=Citrus sinensis TaxID=2711 RepID=A0A067FYN6_CITSI|nr:hypothetical protein CISIN_1g048648mg [Citrus sinensis]
MLNNTKYAHNVYKISQIHPSHGIINQKLLLEALVLDLLETLVILNVGGGLKCQLQQWMRDLKRLQQGAPPGDDDIMLRNAIIVGLGGTLFDGGIFKLTLKFTKEYPVKPPVVPFVSGMFHRNDLKWNSDYDVVAIFATIQLMLGDPNLYSAANQQAATMLTGGRIDYYKKAQRIVELSWKAI